MRTVFKTAKTMKPKTNTKAFLAIDVENIKQKKDASMANVIREYIPEQDASTEKTIGCALLDNKIVGAP